MSFDSVHTLAIYDFCVTNFNIPCTDTEQENSKGKMGWVKALERYKKQHNDMCELKENDGKMADIAMRPVARAKSIRAKDAKRKSLYLIEGQSHSVWIPPNKPDVKTTSFTDVVMEVVRNNKQDLFERQQRLHNRVTATQQVLKVQREEFGDASKAEGGEGVTTTMPQKSKMWQKSIKKVIEDNVKAKRGMRSKHFHDVVSQYMIATSTTSNCVDQSTAESTTTHAKAEARHALRMWRNKYMENKSKKPEFPNKTIASVAPHPLQHGIDQHDDSSCETMPESSSLKQ